MFKRILYCTPRRKKTIIPIPKQAILITLFAFLSVLAWRAPSLHGEEQLALSGITEPIKDVTLSLSVGGTISTIHFREGANVRKGQTLLELDNKLEKLEVARRKLIWEGKAEVESAAAQVSTTKSLLESTRELYNSTGSVSKEELDKLDLEYKLAVSEHTRLQIAEERERIEYEMALETLYKRRLRSPINGTITKLFLEEGESCEPEEPLVQVVDTSRCRLVCNLEEWIGRTLKKGQAVALKIQTGNKSVKKKGTVIFVSPVADPASGLLEVKAEFENQDGTVRPGVTGFIVLKPH